MVFVEFLNPGCFSQLYMIESRNKALTCGIFEGIYWSIFISFFILLIVLRLIIGSKKLELDPEKIKNYGLIMICIVFILLTSFYSIGYVNQWNSYQFLMDKYKKQGLKDYEIFYLLQLEAGKNIAPYGSAISSAAGLLFLGPKDEKKEKEKEIKN